MSRKLKIIMSIVLLFVVLIVSYIILVIKGVLPNPFLETSDLVCVRDESDPGIDLLEQSIITFSFDNKANIKSYKEEVKNSYLTEEIALKTYEAIAKNK